MLAARKRNHMEDFGHLWDLLGPGLPQPQQGQDLKKEVIRMHKTNGFVLTFYPLIWPSLIFLPKDSMGRGYLDTEM